MQRIGSPYSLNAKELRKMWTTFSSSMWLVEMFGVYVVGSFPVLGPGLSQKGVTWCGKQFQWQPYGTFGFWKERNIRIFDNKERHNEDFINQLKVSIVLWMHENKDFKGFSIADFKVCLQKSDISTVVTTGLPPQALWKFNVDRETRWKITPEGSVVFYMKM